MPDRRFRSSSAPLSGGGRPGPALRGGAVAVLVLLVLHPALLTAQQVAGDAEALLRSGPMVGYSSMREVLLWAQTRAPAEVGFEYWVEGAPERRWRTATVRTHPATAHTAKVVADSLEPGRVYEYELLIDGRRVPRPWPLRFRTQTLWQWRGDPPDFRFAVASCFYVNDPPYDRPGEPYGAGFEILERLYETGPEAMLWLGDNVYLREADWWSRTGILYRYSHTRAHPLLQPLLGSTHHYAIWDDHDYGPDNSDWTYREKETTREAFELFWGNPSFGMPGIPGILTTFQWGDAQWFLVDDRWFRSPEHRRSPGRRMLGPRQLEWLIDALRSSEATFKLVAVGSQVLNPYPGWEAYATFPEERAELLRRLRLEGVPGVMFITGDVHHTYLTKLERPGTYPLYDLTVSPLTAGPADVDGEADLRNWLAVPGTLVTERNFATLDFSGPREDRVMTIAVRDVEGRVRWRREIRASELR